MVQTVCFPFECPSLGYPGLSFDNINFDVIFITLNGVFRSTMSFILRFDDFIFEICFITRWRTIIWSSWLIATIFGRNFFSRRCYSPSLVRCSSFLLLLELWEPSWSSFNTSKPLSPSRCTLRDGRPTSSRSSKFSSKS